MQTGITFDKQALTSRQHAHFQNLFLNNTDGITKGCEVSQNEGNVYIQKGFFVVSGRFVEVTGIETVASPEVTSGTLYCKVVYHIDLSKENTASEFNQGYFTTLTSANGYPQIQQDDLDNDGKIYQMPFCQYTKTVTKIDRFVDLRPIFDAKEVWAAVAANNAEYKKIFDDFFDTQKQEVEQMVQDLKGKGYLLVSDARKVRNVTLAANKWTGSAAPYEQTVDVEGMHDEDVPDVGIVYPQNCTRSQQKAINKASGYIYEILTNDGGITVHCTEKPNVDIVLGLKGVVTDGSDTV